MLPEASRTREILHFDLTREIIGAFFDVYNELGHGFVESVYSRSLPMALAARGLRCECELPLTVYFRGQPVGDYRADLVIERKVIVETKAVEKISPIHELQLLNYLRASGIRVGLLLNFGPRATFRRLIVTSPREGSVILRD